MEKTESRQKKKAEKGGKTVENKEREGGKKAVRSSFPSKPPTPSSSSLPSHTPFLPIARTTSPPPHPSPTPPHTTPIHSPLSLGKFLLRVPDIQLLRREGIEEKNFQVSKKASRGVSAINIDLLSPKHLFVFFFIYLTLWYLSGYRWELAR